MEILLSYLTDFSRFLLVLLGFSAIICLHELGHFLAARWAGIRVLAFAVGFGPALVSWRKGLGWARGSSEKDPRERSFAENEIGENGAVDAQEISPTEYRINALPLGGYVKMLGQEDLDPSAVSDESDSYQNAPVWKRMIVISAGVVMNLISAALLFVVVFMAGLDVPPPIVGRTDPASNSARAWPLEREDFGISQPGLRAGDRILTIDGQTMNSFFDLVVAGAMASPDEPLRLTVERNGIPNPLTFDIVPQLNATSGFLDLGIVDSRSVSLHDPESDADREAMSRMLEAIGWRGVRPGMAIVQIGEYENPTSLGVLEETVFNSGGDPIDIVFGDGSSTAHVTLEPQPQLQTDLAPDGEGQYIPIQHVLGLTPLMTVAQTQERGAEQGLQAGDVFISVGGKPYPGVAEAIAAIRAHRGRAIELTVLRKESESAPPHELSLEADVSSEGTIGFLPGTTAAVSNMISNPPVEIRSTRGSTEHRSPPATKIFSSGGHRITAINATPVSNLLEVRLALTNAAREARSKGRKSLSVVVHSLPPQAAGEEVEREWALSEEDLSRLEQLGWTADVAESLFAPAMYTLRAASPIQALAMGTSETQRVMLQTYMTLARLFQGTVKIVHLKGPVGIAHIGTVVVEKGFVWLLFFLAMISVNLAVVNFLPLPIVDGGQFIFLLIEQIRGRPVSIRVQNIATIMGLVLLGTLFLIVTFNDIAGIIRGF